MSEKIVNDLAQLTEPDDTTVLNLVSESTTATPDHVYKIIELAGSSKISIEDAVETAIKKAAQTVRHLRWFEIVQTRGHVQDGKVAHFQVVLKAGFQLED